MAQMVTARKVLTVASGSGKHYARRSHGIDADPLNLHGKLNLSQSFLFALPSEYTQPALRNLI
jgi:hypothetical protein